MSIPIALLESKPSGECAAVFRPRLLSNSRQERHLCYLWDGQRIAEVYEKRALGEESGGAAFRPMADVLGIG